MPKSKVISYEERKMIAFGLQKGMKWKQIADILGNNRSPNTIKNEVRRGGGKQNYDPKKAQEWSDSAQQRRIQKLKALYAGTHHCKPRNIDEVYQKLYTLQQQIDILFEIVNQKKGEKDGSND